MKYKVLEKYTDEVINREDDDGNVVVEVTEIWMRVDIDGEEKNLYLYREEYFDEEGNGKGDSVEYGLSKQLRIGIVMLREKENGLMKITLPIKYLKS